MSNIINVAKLEACAYRNASTGAASVCQSAESWSTRRTFDQDKNKAREQMFAQRLFQQRVGVADSRPDAIGQLEQRRGCK